MKSENPNRKAGRKSKSREILDKMVAAQFPDDSGTSGLEGEWKSRDLVESRSTMGKLRSISHGIDARLEKVLREAESEPDSDSVANRTRQDTRNAMRHWSAGLPTQSVYSTARNMWNENERVIETLLMHLVQHIVIGEELLSLASEASESAREELSDLSAGLVDFANRLYASNVTVRDLRDLPKARLERVVSAILGVDDAEASKLVPGDMPSMSWLAKDDLRTAENNENDDRETAREAAELVSDHAEPSVSEPENGPRTHPGEAEPNDDSEPVEVSDPANGSSMENDSKDGVERSNRPSDAPVKSPEADLETVVEASRKEPETTVETTGVEAKEATDIEAKVVSDQSGNGGGAQAESRPEDGAQNVAAGAVDPVEAMSIDEDQSSEPVKLDDISKLVVGHLPPVDASNTGYVIEEWYATSEDDMNVMSMRLPRTLNMLEMSAPGSFEEAAARMAITDGDHEMAVKFIGRHNGRLELELTEEEQRVWLFLLHEVQTPKRENLVGGMGFFHGVRVPPAKGSQRIRILKRPIGWNKSQALKPENRHEKTKWGVLEL